MTENIPVLQTDVVIQITQTVNTRDYRMHWLWLDGLKPRDIAKRYGLTVRTVEKRIKAVEEEVTTERQREDVHQALYAMRGDALATLKHKVKSGSLEASLAVLRHLGMGNEDALDDFQTMSDEQLDEVMITYVRKVNASGAINTSGTGQVLSVVTKTTRRRTKKVSKVSD